MRNLLLILVSIALSTAVYAGGEKSKTIVFSGSIEDTYGEPLVGAKVELESSNKIAYTDFDGNFTFENILPSEQTIVISHISYLEKVDKISLEENLQNTYKITLRSK